MSYEATQGEMTREVSLQDATSSKVGRRPYDACKTSSIL